MKSIVTVSILGLSLLLSGCGEKKVEDKKVEPIVQQEVKPVKTKEELINEVAADIKNSANTVIDEAAKMAVVASEKSAVIAKELAVETKEIAAAAVESVEEIKKEIDTVADSMIKAQEEEVAVNSKAKGLYLKCAGCHGQKGERSALNKSEIIKGWEVQRTIEALTGYKNDTYGGSMKGVMKSQVSSLSEIEIKLLAEFIAQQ